MYILNFLTFSVHLFYFISYRAAYLVVLKICKLLLTTVGKCIVQVEADAGHCHGSPGSLSPSSPSSVILTGRVSVLQQALTHIPNPNSEFMLRNVSSRLAQLLHDQVCSFFWMSILLLIFIGHLLLFNLEPLFFFN